MPTQQGVRLYDQEGLSPAADTASEAKKPEPIAAGEARGFSLASEENELLPKEGIFSN